MYRKSVIVPFVAFLLAFLAAGVSYKLLTKHLTGSSGSGWFEAGCSVGGDEGSANCAAVLASRYAYWPPQPASFDDTHPTHPEGIPVAFLGMVYFSSLAIWLMAVGRPSYERRWLHLVPMIGLFLGLTGSAYFIYIMATQFEAWCPWCLVIHILNFLIVGCVVYMSPQAAKQTLESPVSATDETGKPAPGSSGKDAEDQGIPCALPPHPSWRVVGLTVVSVVLLVGAESQMLARANLARGYSSAKIGFDQCMAAVKRLRGNSDRLVRLWAVGDAYDIPIRPDEAIDVPAQPDGKAWDLVIFSDFECPSCKRTAAFLEGTVQRLFDGRLRIIFKHFPLNTDCNGAVARTIHPTACKAAQLAEAARLQGGTDAFQRAHDWLFKRQQSGSGLIGLDHEKMAVALNLDARRMAADMHAATTKQRLKEDAQAARMCGLRSTPFILVNGKVVDGVAAKELDFWNLLADRFWQEISIARPASTKLVKQQAPQAGRGSTELHSK